VVVLGTLCVILASYAREFRDRLRGSLVVRRNLTRTGFAAPALDVTLHDGTHADLRALAPFGMTLLVASPSCPHCQADLPNWLAVAAYCDAHSEPFRVLVIGATQEEARGMQATAGIAEDLVVATTDRSALDRLGVVGVPAIVRLDGLQRVIYRDDGPSALSPLTWLGTLEDAAPQRLQAILRLYAAEAGRSASAFARVSALPDGGVLFVGRDAGAPIIWLACFRVIPACRGATALDIIAAADGSGEPLGAFQLGDFQYLGRHLDVSTELTTLVHSAETDERGVAFHEVPLLEAAVRQRLRLFLAAIPRASGAPDR